MQDNSTGISYLLVVEVPHREEQQIHQNARRKTEVRSEVLKAKLPEQKSDITYRILIQFLDAYEHFTMNITRSFNFIPFEMNYIASNLYVFTEFLAQFGLSANRQTPIHHPEPTVSCEACLFVCFGLLLFPDHIIVQFNLEKTHP